MPDQCALDFFQQYLLRYGFGEEVLCACLDSAYAGGNVSVTRHEDNRPASRRLGEFLLNLQTVKIRQLDIEQNTAGSGFRDGSQEAGRGIIGLHLITRNGQQTRNRCTKRRIVVHDVNYRRPSHCAFVLPRKPRAETVPRSNNNRQRGEYHHWFSGLLTMGGGYR